MTSSSLVLFLCSCPPRATGCCCREVCCQPCAPAAAGPRHDPHWALTGPRMPKAPLEQQGWAISIDDGKAKLFGAWCAWLRPDVERLAAETGKRARNGFHK